MIGSLIVFKRLEIAKQNYKIRWNVSYCWTYKRLVRRLNKQLDADVFYEMRYNILQVILCQNLKNYDEIYAIPMYPHYSSTTTKSSIEDFYKSCKKYNIDKNKTMICYYDNPLYNKSNS